MRKPIALFILVAATSLVATRLSAQNIVTNPGFETGDFTGWTQFGNTGFTGVDDGNPHSGTYDAYFGPVGSTGGIFEDLVTVPGTTYTLTFWLASDGGGPNSFDASWGGIPLVSLPGAGSFAYTQWQFVEGATSASTELTFTFRQDPAYWQLDDVSVVAQNVVPEPATMSLLAMGLVGMAGFRRRRKTPVTT
ncbi:MAG: carbohydrate binding domain-containing protein [Gemmatimonadales bacterium]